MVKVLGLLNMASISRCARERRKSYDGNAWMFLITSAQDPRALTVRMS